ncbi:pullulanase-type alpha-1,6-glucosidase [Colwellia sp. MB02u-18]|uniref:pullulanase-type alpha-1,6-glucosidase n=1 Tax=unclassified Colwellia TaxID=196834 RepID=UPI0015F61AAB|nr:MULTISPECIES: pullulanase-type alpha-1,6-glucosidase [unclassified Colwellia]MBA6225379.1 pullulanase-type alpha-1,6-glucosidase [Colwellia sp. MB3u-45]MBA6265981.1 pullulanase-type alpha-1,6-glucosidase [Colwellia sp. MB3u-43]MBA6320754.1 pullulanase-type alpha-1,6-glucosidase [Colwellia sp. MB02u-19]MBA6323308.1 pullulanase-type alpha-1,6-glucosidase [Colwellia sp. MB02u-18]MBA6329671.1 pullulanase-type alpha-1,6-glucosidase [Colwellia sp. MB02u-12]
MKKNYRSLFIYASCFAALLLTACSEQSKKSNSLAAVAEANSLVPAELVAQASDSSVHWLTPNLLVMPKANQQVLYQLLNLAKADIAALDLLAVNLPDYLMKKFPHLADFQAYKVELLPSQAKTWLKQPLVVVGLAQNKQIQDVHFVQTGAVLDALYTQGENDANEETNLGTKITENDVSFKLWAPTAQKVKLLLFNDDLSPSSTASLTMLEDTKSGIWSVVGDSSLDGAYYQYQVTVYHPQSKQIETLITTDPYSLSLSVNSQYSQVVDLNDASTQPLNWQNQTVPKVENIEDNIFYETHIRDFSSDDNALSNNKFRGKYKAFSEQNSSGISHLKALKKAGLNNIHLLPTYDLASINEDDSQSVDINDTVAQVKVKVCDIAPTSHICSTDFSYLNDFSEEQSLKSLLASFDASSAQAQKMVSELRQFDNFNWGYDPFHYTVPEGSYALNPKGKSRLVEFREMVQSIHRLGFRVIMDVVYNHTYQFGLKEKSVLDKIVPHYYHRLNIITGEVEQSTCYTCGNTATERVMMAKLMSDSLVTWARDYKIDGFRFDLMGHQTKSAMLAAREAVRAVDADTYFYGEGWNFGEVANNTRFVQASQLELGGSEIGTYSDRLRDAVRGGGNNTRDSQGLGNGLLMQPNERQTQSISSQKNNVQAYHLRMDQLRIGLTGNLSNFPLYLIEGKAILGKDIPYGDQPTGYALDPADTINYVSKHDNQTLWDNSQYRLAFDVSTADRVRMHLQSLSFVLYAQGIPFLHMGSEFMRSKSFLRDSYDYGDWFNRVDFTQHKNYYHVGLPPSDKDQDNWPLINQVRKGHQGRDHVSAQDISFSAKIFEEMIALRMSSPLFRLTTAEDIIAKVSFLNLSQPSVANQALGLLVMKIDDALGQRVDENVESLLVIFNTSTKAQTFAYPQANDYQLHPIQQNSVDAVLKQSRVDEKGFTVPALSSVVFVKY